MVIIIMKRTENRFASSKTVEYKERFGSASYHTMHAVVRVHIIYTGKVQKSNNTQMICGAVTFTYTAKLCDVKCSHLNRNPPDMEFQMRQIIYSRGLCIGLKFEIKFKQASLNDHYKAA